MMKRNFLRRVGALVLALALTMSLALPAWADDPADPVVTVTIDQASLTLTAGGAAAELTATVNGLPEGTDIEYAWSCEASDGSPISGEFEVRGDGAKATVTPRTEIVGAEITVSASWTPDGGTTPRSVTSAPCTLTIEKKPDPKPVEGMTLNKDTLTLAVGDSETLTATVTPDGADDKTVKWSSDKTSIATVDQTGKVTAVAVGEAVITATTNGKDKDGNAVTAECKVTVTAATIAATGIQITGVTESQGRLYLQINKNDKNNAWGSGWDMTAQLTPADSTDKIEWETVAIQGDNSTPEVVKLGTSTGNGKRIHVTRASDTAAGQVIVRAYAVDANGNRRNITPSDCYVTVSGIVLNKSTLRMIMKETEELYILSHYGDARGGSSSNAADYWDSSDDKIVSVASGVLSARDEGTAIITAEKNGYIAKCTVTVGEDVDSIAGPYQASAGEPLVIANIYSGLNTSSIRKTGSGLRYITNVIVPTNAGTLYYNYNSEANTGEGVGISDAFYYSGSGQKLMSRLYFVPRQGFSGEAEITYNGWSEGGQSYAGVIKVRVDGTGGISYRTTPGNPATFLGSDFNAYCRSQTGRDLNYVTFSLPQSGVGTLYYEYSGSGQYSQRVSTSTQYSRSGRNLIDGVSFVPNQNYLGEVSIGFRAVDTAGTTFNGWVTINVASASDSADSADVYFSADRGQRVTFRASEFYYACRNTIGDSLAYVRFELPAYDEGVLYYNYQSSASPGTRVDNATRYYYSGTPSLSSVTFVPASSSTGLVAIPYIGYGTGGTTYTGTVYIGMNGEAQGAIRYSVSKGSSIAFRVNDFNNACLTQTGANMDYVQFQVPSSLGTSTSSVGTLYYDYRSSVTYNTQVSSSYRYYRTNTTSSWSRYLLSNITFHAKTNASTVNIPYYGYSTNNIRFEGTVVIQIGSLVPSDAYLYGNTSRQVWLSSSALRAACSSVMRSELSYIEITGLPAADEGTLYTNYSGFNTGTKVTTGTRYYRNGSPSIDQISFVPQGGYTGTSVITYIGYSSNGQEQVSGKINVVITKSDSSRYFNDLGGHTWAIDAVDYLYENHVVDGVGNGRYNPSGNITKGDFALMLVRTFGLSTTGRLYFHDVPANSYYADAINTVCMLGIAGSSYGYFYPKSALTRQDAMVMIRNAMVAAGRSVTNGLTEDLSAFYDRGDIAPYARSAVGSLVQMGVVKGDGNGRLRPAGTLTRAEMATLMHQVMTL